MAHEEQLAAVPLFSQLPRKDLSRLGRVVVERNYKNDLGPGGVFGEMALLDGGPRAATVKALEDSTCLVLSRWDFVAELRTNPMVAVGMLPILSRRLREVEAKLAQTHTH
jgi:CRP-like cAMP-binding protein